MCCFAEKIISENKFERIDLPQIDVKGVSILFSMTP